MNFIIASLLHYCEEAEAFHIFKYMMEEQELREVLINRHVSIERHMDQLGDLMQTHYPQIHE